jgi:hypothetical protein
LTTPSWDWKSHWKTVVAAITGIAQATTRPPITANRIHLPRAPISSATRVPSTMIRLTLIAV